MDQRTCWSERKHDRLKSMKTMKSLWPELQYNERSRTLIKMMKIDDHDEDIILEDSEENNSETVIIDLIKGKLAHQEIQ